MPNHSAGLNYARSDENSYRKVQVWLTNTTHDRFHQVPRCRQLAREASECPHSLQSPKQCLTIDAGTTTKGTVIDINGKPGLAAKGGKVDVGCYEVK